MPDRLRTAWQQIPFWSTRRVALEWGAREVRAVVGRVQAGRLVIESAVQVALPPPDEGTKGPPPGLVERLLEAWGGRAPSRAQALVCVERSLVDLRQIPVESVPDAALPEAVRQQAVRELTSMTERDLLDFVALNEPPAEPRIVAAAAMSPDHVQQIEAVCRALNLRVEHIAVRPFAAGALWRHRAQSERTTLLIDAAPDEADLTVLHQGRVVFSRTARLASAVEGESPHAPLLAEIRRTLMAMPNQPTGETVEAIVILGDAAEQAALLASVTQEFDLPAEVFDPWAGLPLPPEVEVGRLGERGRFGALIGMLEEHAAGRAPVLDFLHPRKTPAPANPRRRLAVGGGVAATTAAAAFFGIAWQTLAGLDTRIDELRRQATQLDKQVKRARETQAAVSAIEAWTENDVVWLDELRDLTARFPKRRDALLLRLTLGRSPLGGGSMELQGLVRDPGIVGRLESTLRDPFHEVRSKRVQESVRGKVFTWQFDSSLSVKPRVREQYLASFAARERRPWRPTVAAGGRLQETSVSPGPSSAGPPGAVTAESPTEEDMPAASEPPASARPEVPAPAEGPSDERRRSATGGGRALNTRGDG